MSIRLTGNETFKNFFRFILLQKTINDKKKKSFSPTNRNPTLFLVSIASVRSTDLLTVNHLYDGSTRKKTHSNISENLIFTNFNYKNVPLVRIFSTNKHTCPFLHHLFYYFPHMPLAFEKLWIDYFRLYWAMSCPRLTPFSWAAINFNLSVILRLFQFSSPE